MTTWFTSDTHFNHKSIIDFCSRPFEDVWDMNQKMIQYWNDMVRPQDDIWVVGDFGFTNRYGDDLEEIFKSLNGHKFLVIGNHDERNPKVLKLPWEKQIDLGTVRDDKRRAIVCHYPLETWKDAQRGRIMVHGHSHGTLKNVINHRFDVGVDCWDYHPVSFDELWAIAENQDFNPVDHHGDQMSNYNKSLELFGYFCPNTHIVWATLGRGHKEAGCCYPVYRPVIRRSHPADIVIREAKSMTFEEWEKQVLEFVPYQIGEDPATDIYRIGQNAFNSLHTIKPEIANALRATDFDPFYVDDNLYEFIAEVERIAPLYGWL